MDAWREILYPLGFLSGLAFGGRILLQWLTSEARKESVVPRAFWQLSLLGNILLILHSLIQAQFHVYIIQIGNAVISWRNLNLMMPIQKQIGLKKVVALLCAALALSTLFFFFTNGFFSGTPVQWFRVPTFSWLDTGKPINAFWHALGFVGLALFSSRFWIQWWCAEKEKTSYLGPLFWWVSLAGDLLTLVYFARIKDPVNLIGPVCGLIPYIRNLMLIYKNQEPTVGTTKG